MATPPSQGSPRWLALVGVVSASGALVMGLWQCAFLGLGWAAGAYISEMEGLVRVSAASGVFAAFAALPLARLLMRPARRSAVLSIALIPLGLVGMYFLVPRVFVYANF